MENLIRNNHAALRFALTAAVLSGSCLFASTLKAQDTTSSFATTASNSLPDAPSALTTESASPQASSSQTASQPSDLKQTTRILGIIPNFRAVSADVKLPPQTPGQKFKTGFQDSFDYSALIFVAVQSGINDASNSTPEFSNTGASGGVVYGRYFWHSLVDNADENLLVESVLPIVTHEDNRYYTLGHGSYVKRAGYALTRGLVTRTDSGTETFNASEVFGAGAAAGISALYYPSGDRTFSKVAERWGTSIAIDSVTFAVKEFWPDINHALFHTKNKN